MTPSIEFDASTAFVPALAAFHTTPKTWEVYCPCGSWHVHGPGDGHRVAHCLPGRAGSLNPTGYFISDSHADADIVQRRARPKLEPIAWYGPRSEAAA